MEVWKKVRFHVVKARMLMDDRDWQGVLSNVCYDAQDGSEEATIARCVHEALTGNDLGSPDGEDLQVEIDGKLVIDKTNQATDRPYLLVEETDTDTGWWFRLTIDGQLELRDGRTGPWVHAASREADLDLKTDGQTWVGIAFALAAECARIARRTVS